MKRLIKHLLIALIVSAMVFLFVLVLNILNGNSINSEWLKYATIINLSYALPLYFVSAYSFHFVRLYSSKKDFPIWKNTLLVFPLVIILNVFLILLIQYLLNTLLYDQQVSFFGDNIWDRVKVPLYISFTIGTVFYIFNYIIHYQREKNRKNILKVNQVTQSHEALKSQIGPHFLFNSLNVLSGLVDENPERAQTFIADLAQVYRYVLDQKDKEWVSLAEEIDFADNYLALIKTRFEDGLDIQIEEDLKTSELQMAPLTLQLLLENCIKHNAISKEKPLEIKIFKLNNMLVVENNLNLKKVFQKREGTGLNQIKQRYAFMKQEVKVTRDQNRFRVEVPLLQIEELNS